MPAAHCGIVGLKPTYGRVSTRGVMTLSWTLDHVGPMCKSVEDVALMMNVIAGYDDLDPTTADVPTVDYTRALKAPTSKLRLGVPRKPFYDNLDPDVARAVDAAMDVLRRLTAGMTDVQLPATPNPGTIWGPEALVYHSKWIAESPEKLPAGHPPIARRSMQAKATDYVIARRRVETLRREIKSVFANVDLLITPTMKTPPPKLERRARPEAVATTTPRSTSSVCRRFRCRADSRPWACRSASRSAAPRLRSRPSWRWRRRTSRRRSGMCGNQVWPGRLGGRACRRPGRSRRTGYPPTWPTCPCRIRSEDTMQRTLTAVVIAVAALSAADKPGPRPRTTRRGSLRCRLRTHGTGSPDWGRPPRRWPAAACRFAARSTG
jgi:hypothetical protein